MELRKYPRVRARFRSSFSSAHMVGGEGIVIDLSKTGCGITSEVRVEKDTPLELRLHTPEQESPLHIDQAIVRWSRAGQFGVEFLQLQPDTEELLGRLIAPR